MGRWYSQLLKTNIFNIINMKKKLVLDIIDKKANWSLQLLKNFVVVLKKEEQMKAIFRLVIKNLKILKHNNFMGI